jgi:hypothetical protein
MHEYTSATCSLSDSSLSVKDFLDLPADACSVSAAIAHLKGYLDVPLNVAQAITYLQQLDGLRPFHRLYRRYFPLEWSCSTASVSSDFRGGYSPRETEFLRLVETRLFPLDSDYLVDQAEDGRVLDRIELLPYAPNWWDLEEEIDLAWHLLMLVSGMLHPDEALRQLDELEDLISSLRKAITTFILKTRGYFSLQPLYSLCQALGSPLHYLPITLEMLRYETGNEWLDVTGEDGSLPFDHMSLCWREKDLDFLTHTFRAAQNIEYQARILIDWVKLDLDTHMWETLSLLERAYMAE